MTALEQTGWLRLEDDDAERARAICIELIGGARAARALDAVLSDNQLHGPHLTTRQRRLTLNSDEVPSGEYLMRWRSSGERCVIFAPSANVMDATSAAPSGSPTAPGAPRGGAFALAVAADGRAWETDLSADLLAGDAVLGELVSSSLAVHGSGGSLALHRSGAAQFVSVDLLTNMASRSLNERVDRLSAFDGSYERLKRAAIAANANVRFDHTAQYRRLQSAARFAAPPYPKRGVVLVFANNCLGIRERRIEESSFEIQLGGYPYSPFPMPQAVVAMLEDLGERRRSGVPELDVAQARALRAARSGRNLFLTGNPGCGKTHALRLIVAALKADCGEHAVLVTAPTGAAAQQCGGQTMHQCPGPYWPSPAEMLFVAQVMCKPRAHATWKQLRVLVIDEVSMVDAELLDWLDCAVREAREDVRQAFGGLQIVFCGDFAQLPPVKNSDTRRQLANARLRASMARSLDVKLDGTPGWLPYSLAECSGKYAFQSCCWLEARLDVHVLITSHRQSDDRVLLDALAALRRGDGSHQDVLSLVAHTARQLPSSENGVEPTRLFCRRVQVADLNERKLNALPGMPHVFTAMDSVEPLERHAGNAGVLGLLHDDPFFNDCLAASSLELRVGAQVILLKKEVGRSGSSAAHATDSRLQLVNGSRGVVTAFNREGWPNVAFENGRNEVVKPVEFAKAVILKGRCVRMQLPLALAWALTVHKSQGLSLDWMCADLLGAFEKGQAYVAISRAAGVGGLQIANFTPSVVLHDALVTRFNRAVDDGGMQQFVENQVPLWWKAIADKPFWRERFRRRNVHFERWMQLYGAPFVDGYGGGDDDEGDDEDDDDGEGLDWEEMYTMFEQNSLRHAREEAAIQQQAARQTDPSRAAYITGEPVPLRRHH